jgi:hypothetical protein
VTETLPPVRTTHVFRAPAGSWCYDIWGLNGRPVVFLPAVLFGRTSWWPVAADLRPHATVVAVELPGHDSSGRRVRYEPAALVDDLAHLVDSLQTRRAPVVVGHGTSAVLADLFAARYATHAVVTVDPCPAAGLDAYLEAMDVGAIPGQYRHMVEAARDPDLLAAYATVLRDLRPATATMGVHPARLAVYSRRADVPATERLWRHEVYDVPGRFAHLAAVQRFVADIKGLL